MRPVSSQPGRDYERQRSSIGGTPFRADSIVDMKLIEELVEEDEGDEELDRGLKNIFGKVKNS